MRIIFVCFDISSCPSSAQYSKPRLEHVSQTTAVFIRVPGTGDFSLFFLSFLRFELYFQRVEPLFSYVFLGVGWESFTNLCLLANCYCQKIPLSWSQVLHILPLASAAEVEVAIPYQQRAY